MSVAQKIATLTILTPLIIHHICSVLSLLLLGVLVSLPDLLPAQRGGTSSYYNSYRSRQVTPRGGKVNRVGKRIARRGVGKTVTTGAGTPGDLIVYSFDRNNGYYEAENLTNGAYLGGQFEAWRDPRSRANANLFHYRDANGYSYYGVELANRFITTNFPAGTEKVSIYSGFSSTIDNYQNFQYFNGAYLVFHLNLEDHSGGEYSEGMDWGIAILSGENPQQGEGIFLMKIYNTNDWLPDEINLQEEIDLLVQEAEGTYQPQYDDEGFTLAGYYGVDPDVRESFNVFFFDMEDAQYSSEEELSEMGTYLAGTGYATAQEGVMTLDLGEGNGFLQLVRITDATGQENAPYPYGSFLYVQSDVDYGSGGGFFTIYDDDRGNHILDIEHYPEYIESEENIMKDYGLSLKTGNLGSVFFTDFDYYDVNHQDDNLERLYLIINHDFSMHFTIDIKNRSLLNYGIGAYGEE